MYRKFIATIAVASIAVTAFTAKPAAADNKDLARIAAGVLGVAIIGKIISDNNKRNDQRGQVVTRHNTHPAPVYRAPQASQHGKLRPRPLPQGYGNGKHRGRANAKLLPQHCFQNFQTHRGSVQMFTSRCLQQNYRHAHTLPQHCAQQIRTRHGDRFGYDARCLRGAGYSLARG